MCSCSTFLNLLFKVFTWNICALDYNCKLQQDEDEEAYPPHFSEIHISEINKNPFVLETKHFTRTSINEDASDCDVKNRGNSSTSST